MNYCAVLEKELTVLDCIACRNQLVSICHGHNHSIKPRIVDDLPLGEINEVYLLDFIGSSGFIGELYPKVESVIILDHHKTAVEALCGNASFGKNVIKVIDMDKSGATIAFDFFKEKLLKRSDTLKGLGIHNHQEAGQKNLSGCKFERVQKLFEYIEDGDIWRWKLPHSKAFSSGLKDMNIEYNVNVNSALFEQDLLSVYSFVISVVIF
ncbi:hypothetical protein ZIOFF_009376 [Zingiber officinale]|uniref:Uncharacterized protein n=1 Tax=Zingiber officinale TaxID=94328 RepID=A0A8J5HKX5_ZINOF|nr:hypothetical protein ZIOFF_009376 [Zingiber officinale]